MATVALIQARMGSTRLPGKVLKDLAGEPALGRLVKRTMRSRRLDAVVVITSTAPEDDQIVEFCRSHRWPVFRGSLEDVLDRYYQAALCYRADVVVRITADCPLMDPEHVDAALEQFARQPGLDYLTTVLKQSTFPGGLNLEIVTFAALERVWRLADRRDWREHVTLYIRHHPECFVVKQIQCECDHSRFHLALDTRLDLQILRHIYEHFGDDRFSWRKAIAVFEDHPEWSALER